MTRFVTGAIAALLAATPAAAQVWNGTFREEGVPVGLSLPVLGAAGAEEPTALGTNPAGIGFVRRLNLQYFYEEGPKQDNWGSGIYAAAPLGPLALGLGVEWLGPAGVFPAKYQRTTFAAGLTDGRALSAAFAWHWYGSPSDAVADVGGWDVGATWRPWRHLSIAAATLGRDAYLSGQRLPAVVDFGLATRFLDDRITVAADLVGEDAGSHDRHLDFAAVGLGGELPGGFALTAQVAFPLRTVAGSHDPSALISLAWNLGVAGATGGGVVRPSGGGWLVGGRVSGEAYRGPGLALSAPVLDLHDELEQSRPLLILLGGDEDPWGALLGRLERARTDPSVGLVVLRIDELPIGTGRAEELREAIAAIRRKKPVLAYLQGGGQREYYLATAASSIAAPPGVTLMVNGISSSSFYVKEGLSRLGVTVEVVQAGAYKSAPEPLTRTGPSAAAREVRTAILDDIFARQVGTIAAARKLPEARVRTLIDEGLFTSEAAKAAGLVDEVLWPDELDAWARRATGHGLWLERRWRPPPLRAAQRWSRPAIVAVVPIEGIIAGGESRFDPIGDQLTGGESVAEQLNRAVEDGRVRAIVLRIDSPGGDGAASDLIWREVVRARRQGKPVVAWMGDIAASGGYLAAVGADAIVAEPSTLTGSIGVFALKPDLSGTLAKLGVNRDADRRGEKAELLSITRPWSAGERRAVEGQVNAFYEGFVDRVAEGRHLSRAEVEPLARGRVWTGREAFERRLVDRLGSFEDAVALARERAHLGPDAAVELRRFDPRAGGGLLRLLAQEPPLAPALRTVPTLRAALVLAELGPVLALPPTWVEPGNGP